MAKTTFLNYLLEKANMLKNADGNSQITSNYFMLALLDTVKLPELPKGLEKAEKEIDMAKRMLKAAGYDDYDAAMDIISEAVKASGYSGFMDGMIFKKILMNLETIKNESSVPDVLQLVLKEPSEAMRLAANKQEKPAFDGTLLKKQDSKPAEQRDYDLGAKVDKKEPKPIVTEPGDDEKSGTEKLSGAVSDTQRIQKELLDVVFGQDHAVNTFVSGYFQSKLMALSNRESKKPHGTFLFAGPPGVGKTFLAETAAKALGLPFQRFDMSEYADSQAHLEFCGYDKAFKGAKEGNVTGFVAENPECVILFDEIEKAHLNVIHLFLQILDAGRIRDNFTDKEVPFSKATIILTTNAGKNLYNEVESALSSIPRKKVLKALSTDVNPLTGSPLFPAAICSRFASGNVVMFNHLGASDLHRIAACELEKNMKSFTQSTAIALEIAEEIPSAILFAEGGNADARTVTGRSGTFFHEELYELFRLLESNGASVDNLKKIKIGASFEGASADIIDMFGAKNDAQVMIFADSKVCKKCVSSLKGITCHTASRIDDAKEILFNHDVSLILCDIRCGMVDNGKNIMNAEDINSVGMDFLDYVLGRYTVPVHLIVENNEQISGEEFLSFAKRGVDDMLDTSDKDFAGAVIKKCNIACQQNNMLKLSRENKVLTYKTVQLLSADKTEAQIYLTNFALNLSTDVEDSGNVLDNVSKPSVRFDDVIGAADAKGELKYFVEYLKDPIKYMRKGVKAPRGVLLYGPPGTGKTMLAKAMAGESDVTFLTAEGNQFLKKYVGEGSEAVHKLFNAARKYAPSILFVDEIDAIGKDRKSSAQGDATGDVLTAFLTEMDGFKTDSTKPVFVLAATNYDVEPGGSRSLDPALLRRFDRRIYVDLPNKEERKRYIEMKAAKNGIIAISPEQIDNIAMRSTGMSLAELESVFEMALRNAIRSNGEVNDTAFEEAFETFNNGEKKEWSPELLERTARHEAGHALLCWLGGEKPSYLTIVARGSHGGYMQHADNEGKALRTRSELRSLIRTALAGRAAEMVYYGDEGVSTGASGDLDSATRTAKHMICSYGMDEKLGLACINEPTGEYFLTIHNRVNEILAEELENAIDIIAKNKAAIDALVSALIEKNHLKEKEIDEIFKKTIKQ